LHPAVAYQEVTRSEFRFVVWSHQALKRFSASDAARVVAPSDIGTLRTFGCGSLAESFMRESASNRPCANLPGFRGNTRRISGSRHRSFGPLPSSASCARSLCRMDASASTGLVREATDSTESTGAFRESQNPSGFTGSSEPTAPRSHRTLRGPPSSSELTATMHCLGFLRESPRALRSFRTSGSFGRAP
jgi:hypothetical protein